MKRQDSGLPLIRTGRSDQPDAAAGQTDALVPRGSAGQLELATVPKERNPAADSPSITTETPAGAASAAAADAGSAHASAPKRRVSFAKKGGDAVIQIHADGTAGAAEPLLTGVGTSAGVGAATARSSTPAESDSAGAAHVVSAGGSRYPRPGLRSGRKQAHLTVKNNAVAPMPRHRPLSEEPPSRSVSHLRARPLRHDNTILKCLSHGQADGDQSLTSQD